MFGQHHPTGDERHQECLKRMRPSEEFLVPIRSVEEFLLRILNTTDLQMLNTTERSALKSWKSKKAS